MATSGPTSGVLSDSVLSPDVVYHGNTLILAGEANDDVSKGLAGGRLIITPPPESRFDPHNNILIGNTVLYGATGGEGYFRGVVVVLGQTGRHFAAGMSGGVAYGLDEAGDFEQRVNLAMVELEPITDGLPA